jgi:CheY-like chemotaxis protein
METACSGATILLVEDNPDHAMLAKKAFTGGNLITEVFWVKDGQQALDFLAQRGEWAEPGAAPRPGLIVLDIHLPKVDGHEVLRRIKSDPVLRTTPVVMLTTSERRDDVTASYEGGANSYVTKPVSAKQFVDELKALKLYWLFTNQLPL